MKYSQYLRKDILPGMPVFLLLVFPLLVLSLPGYAAVDLVKVDKSERMMYLIKGNQVVKQFRIALGANPKGHKRQRGDEKTPEGTYTLDYKKEDSSFYRAMHISYPNAQDIANARRAGVSPGGLIMVHGQKNGFGRLGHVAQRFNWTDGCIALTNREMDEFMALVKVGTTIRIEW
ncbi:L,D-transpeptidase family protein [Vibrio quintilis]|uniref:L,D-transpeptidase catalytic domain n=1 Tax=Vibrio quintilis TaxID=1117707 RepID=A0A1M7YY94_9VIBR|nr:L,D-transpeptidase family protein [Vibrio quintilis]SHO57523.1 L,D-transpeptidase catalytic domain [Vibrio quintilis]